MAATWTVRCRSCGLNEYVERYHRHPEAKAADQNGNPAGPETIGLLGRLRVRSRKLARIGKEVDRLDEDEGAALEPEQPIEYERDDLAEDIAYLAHVSAGGDGARSRTDGARMAQDPRRPPLAPCDHGAKDPTGGRATTVRLREIKALEGPSPCAGYLRRLLKFRSPH